jgi:hypothetical protein
LFQLFCIRWAIQNVLLSSSKLFEESTKSSFIHIVLSTSLDLSFNWRQKHARIGKCLRKFLSRNSIGVFCRTSKLSS